MACQRTMLFLVLAWAFFKVAVEGWTRKSSTPVVSEQSRDVSKMSEGSFFLQNFDDSDDYTEGNAEVQFGDSTNFYPYADHGYEVQFNEMTEAKNRVPMAKAAPVSVAVPTVLCSEDEFKVTLPAGPLSEVKILGSKSMLSVLDAEESCGYDMIEENDHNTLTVQFSGCHVRHEDGRYTLWVLYVNEAEQMDVAAVSCAASHKSSGPSTTHVQPPASPHVPSEKTSKSSGYNPEGCSIPRSYQVACGYPGIASSQCQVMGCCVCPATSHCYYPMDECTADKQFVFAIHHDVSAVPVDPRQLVIPGKAGCRPVIANERFAIFKFSVTECSTRSYEIDETMIYLAVVYSLVKTLNLKFGIITRDNPLRVMVECRYPKKVRGDQPAVASVGYMVKSPSLNFPSKLTSEGLFGVQLRIAEDKTYSKYLPQYHQPLHLLLGKPVYLEVRLKSPKPKAVLLVNYCLAYPHSAKNALVLIHEGCANPLDPSVAILKVGDLPQNRHQRRFVVTVFQFMNQQNNKYLNEEIYFMCSTEVCMPAERDCEERCFDGKAGPQKMAYGVAP